MEMLYANLFYTLLIVWILSGLFPMLILVLYLDGVTKNIGATSFSKRLHEHLTSKKQSIIGLLLTTMLFGPTMGTFYLRVAYFTHKRFKLRKRLRIEMLELLFILDHAPLKPEEEDEIKKRIEIIRDILSKP